MSKYEEFRLQSVALLSTGSSVTEVAQQFGIPTSVVNKWINEARMNGDKLNLETILEAPDDVYSQLKEEDFDMTNQGELLHRMADTVTDKLVNLANDTKEITGDVMSSVDGLKSLDTEMQNCALKITNKIALMATTLRDPKDALTLADALAKLQASFFAKGTNVNVLNMPGATSSDNVSAFSSLKRDA